VLKKKKRGGHRPVTNSFDFVMGKKGMRGVAKNISRGVIGKKGVYTGKGLRITKTGSKAFLMGNEGGGGCRRSKTQCKGIRSARNDRKS